MKKSSFIALLLGTVAGVLFSLGMCMALLPEWNAFVPGVIFGAVGFVIGVVTLIVWCRLENKSLPKVKKRTFLQVLYAVLSVLVLGVGMCLCLVWEQIIWGTLVGLLGMVMLIFFIPMVKGIK